MKGLVAPLLLLVGAAGFALAVARGARHPWGLAPVHYGATRVEGQAFPKRITGAGAQIIPRAPRHIASLTVTADEVLMDLVEPERIRALTHFVDDPSVEPSATRAPRTAARIRGADPEGVIALEPDLVFVAHYTMESAVRILSAAAIPVIRLGEIHSFEDVAANVALTAAAVGEEARGASLVSRMRERLSEVQRRTHGLTPRRVLYYSAVGYTAGSRTLVDEKIRLAGGRNVAAEAGLVGFKEVALDVLIAMDPDVIVVPRWTSDATAPVRDVTENAAWRDVAAVRAGRVHAMAAGALTSEAPEGASGVEELARLLHPEAFPS